MDLRAWISACGALRSIGLQIEVRSTLATVAAVGFAGLLVVILRSNEVRGLLLDIIRNALSV
jgi:hypothetical protein